MARSTRFFPFVLLINLFLGATSITRAESSAFRRGDVNADGAADLSDAVATLEFLFTGGELTCHDAADANDDGVVDLSDAVSLLALLFLGEGVLPAPGLDCGIDPTEDLLGCEGSESCGDGHSFEIVDGFAVDEEDIVIGSAEDLLGQIEQEVPDVLHIPDEDRLWPDGVVPFTYSAELAGDPSGGVGAVRDAIDYAMGHWEEQTNIRFLELTTTNASSYPDYVTFRLGSRCMSPVGRQGDQQFVTVDYGCGPGHVIHEIGHAVGLRHEHQRSDRYDYIAFRPENIDNHDAFRILHDVRCGPYDYGSIMHYGSWRTDVAGCTPNKDECIIIDSPEPIGQRDGLSLGDIWGIRSLYDDLPSACKADHTIHLFLGDGLGGFTPLPTLTFGGTDDVKNPTSVVIADLDGSGDLDLAIAFQGTLFAGGNLVILTNDGGGTSFTSQVISSAPSIGAAMGVAAADFDGDSNVDLAITDAGSTASDNKIHLIRNTGSGYDGAAFATLTALLAPRGIAAEDVNGDGNQDLVVASFGNGGFTDDGGVTTFLGDGTGAFPTTVTDAGATGRSGASAVAIGDLNVDSDPDTTRLDVVYLNLASANFTELMRFDAMTGDYALSSTASSGGSSPTDLVIADVDGDCAPDVVVADLGAQALFVHAGIPRALAQTYGTGCGGSTGIPTIGTSGTPNLPELGNGTFAVTLGNTKPASLAILAGGTEAGILPGACSNLLINPLVFTFVQFTSLAGTSTFALPVPNDTALVCGNLYMQWAVLDNTGGFASLFTLSRGLRLRVGH